jgi:hypothetical protein
MATGTAATFNAAIGSSNIGNSLKLDWLKCKGGVARIWRLDTFHWCGMTLRRR